MPSNTGVPRPGNLLATLALALALLAAAIPISASAQPGLPAVFYGTASIDGAPPPPTAVVRVYIGEVDCTQDPEPVAFQEGTAVFVVTALHESQRSGCGAPGRTVTFRIDDQPAAQSAAWDDAPAQVDLNVGSGSPAPIPPAFATAQGSGGLTSGVTSTLDDPGSSSSGDGFP
ncbi:MAG: hypothetical protein ACSLFM_12830, partial [Tepidiformaceae bacterium]